MHLDALHLILLTTLFLVTWLIEGHSIPYDSLSEQSNNAMLTGCMNPVRAFAPSFMHAFSATLFMSSAVGVRIPVLFGG
jgi:hypothetical protein